MKKLFKYILVVLTITITGTVSSFAGSGGGGVVCSVDNKNVKGKKASLESQNGEILAYSPELIILLPQQK